MVTNPDTSLTPEVYETWLSKRLKQKRREPLWPTLGWKLFIEPGDSSVRQAIRNKRLREQFDTAMTQRKEARTH